MNFIKNLAGQAIKISCEFVKQTQIKNVSNT